MADLLGAVHSFMALSAGRDEDAQAAHLPLCMGGVSKWILESRQEAVGFMLMQGIATLASCAAGAAKAERTNSDTTSRWFSLVSEMVAELDTFGLAWYLSEEDSRSKALERIDAANRRISAESELLRKVTRRD